MVRSPAKARFTASVTVRPVFTGPSDHRANPPAVSYDWTFGDGATGSGRVFTHRYAHQGVYTVALTVTDDRRATATATEEVAVESGSPSAVIDVSPAGPAVGQPVAFSGLRSAARPGRTLVAYAWVFGDAGATAQGVTATHAYRAAGTYVVTLTVTDDFGASATARETVSVGRVPAAARSPPRGGP